MLKRYLQKGHRLFTAASLMAIVIAFAHTSALLNIPEDDSWTAAFDVMKTASVAPDAPKPNLLDVMLGLWLQVGALLLLLGLKNMALLAVVPIESSGRVIRVMSLVDGIVCAVMAILFVFVFIPPPLISFAILAVMFLLTAIRGTKPTLATNE
jgi:hypothetical protein